MRLRTDSGAISATIWTFLSLTLSVRGLPTQSLLSTPPPCPAQCTGHPDNWNVYSSTAQLDAYQEPLLLDFSVYNPLGISGSTIKIRACTVQNNTIASDTHRYSHIRRNISSDSHYDNSGYSGPSSSKMEKATLNLAVSNDKTDTRGDDIESAFQNIHHYLANQSNHDTKLIFAYTNGAAVGVYTGLAIDSAATMDSIIQRAASQIGVTETPKTMIAEFCDAKRTGDDIFGLAVDTSGDLAFVQKAVRTWNDGSCVNGRGTANMMRIKDVSIFERPNSTALNARYLHAKGDCRTVTAAAGDSCGSLARKCGISPADFIKFNPEETMCSTLAAGLKVCCSEGSLPDITPKPQVDGTCATHVIQSGDSCSTIAATNGLKVSDIERFNSEKTWSWHGCNHLLSGTNICLSTGKPPMPAPISNAVCGPTKPNTTAPADNEELADLNPCPYNACCDIWGQCGNSPQSCAAKNGPTGNPGTAPLGKNGCISNCDTSITNKHHAQIPL